MHDERIEPITEYTTPYLNPQAIPKMIVKIEQGSRSKEKTICPKTKSHGESEGNDMAVEISKFLRFVFRKIFIYIKNQKIVIITLKIFILFITFNISNYISRPAFQFIIHFRNI